ncbi:unnamed protein product [Camellia sinensis]
MSMIWILSLLLLLVGIFANGFSGNVSSRPAVVNIGAIFTFESTIGRVAKIEIEEVVEDVKSNTNVLHGTKLVLQMQDSNCSGFLGLIGDKPFSIEMEGVKTKPLLHTLRFSPLIAPNRVFAVVYTCAILALLYHHAITAFHSTTLLSFSISIPLLISDVILRFMWAAKQSFRMNPVHRQVFRENLEKIMKKNDFQALDIFICTADPYKEPPMSVVNTALSVMAYDYPTEKLSVYVSDDGGSAMTLFAFMEAAKFGSHWLPFCRRNKLVERCPDAYFRSNHHQSSEVEQIKKMMYESMKARVENVVERGKVGDEYIASHQQREAFNKWNSQGFTRQDHPTVIQ